MTMCQPRSSANLTKLSSTAGAQPGGPTGSPETTAVSRSTR